MAVEPAAARRPHGPRLGVLPSALWAAGIAAMLVATQGAAWPLALGWSAAGIPLAWAWRALARRPATRAALCVVLMAALVLTTFEGGLFLLPAALAGLAVSLSSTSSRRSPGRTSGPAAPPRPSG